MAHGYGDVILYLVQPNNFEVTCMIEKVSWAPLLGHNLRNTILFAKKRIDVFLW